MEERNPTNLKEKWVVFRNTPKGIDYLFDISCNSKIHTTCYIENAMAFPTKETAKKMQDVLEEMSEDWFGSGIARLITSMEVAKD